MELTEEELRITRLVFNTIGDIFLADVSPALRDGLDAVTLVGLTTHKVVESLFEQGLVSGLEYFKVEGK
jgi:hypothetical protein